MGRSTSQRTKGNTKPSNSLRSAQLLSSTIGNSSLSAFIGFDSTKFTSQHIRNLTDSDDINTESLDQDLLLALKQLSKKDSITKIKVLNKFAQICKEKNVTLIKPLLPKWTRVFNKLALDYDFRVREACFKAHEVVVTKVGKNIAPHLKQMMAVWILCLHDPYPLASSAANSSFRSAFVPCKQPEALSYCKEEIFNYAKDIILVHTPQTIDDKSTSNEEERKAQYARLVCCSLAALRYLVTELQNREMIQESLDTLLQNDKFWKFAQNKDTNVKIAWYKLKSAICEYLPNLAQKFGEKLTLTCLNNIDEKDITLSPYVWENVLWTLMIEQDCWNYINFEKQFVPKLHKLLQTADGANISSIYPNLLLLLSKLPLNKLKDPLQFYVKFLDSFETGMTSNHLISKNFSIIAKHYFECIWYLMKDAQVKVYFQEQNLEIDQFIFDRLNSKIHLFLKTWQDIYLHYFINFTSFLEKLQQSNRHQIFLQLIDHTFVRLITEASSSTSSITLIPKLLESILQIYSNRNEKKKIRFGESSEVTSIECFIEPKIASLYSQTLNLIWNKLLDQSADFHQNTTWLLSLKDIHQILTHYNKSSSMDCLEGFEDYLMNWITIQSKSTDCEDKQNNIKLLIGMFFNLFDTSPDKLKILHFLTQFKEFTILLEFMKQLKMRVDKDGVILNWFNRSEANNLLINTILKVIEESQKSEGDQIEALKQCLTYFFKLKLDSNIIDKLSSCLKDALNQTDITSYTIELICDLIVNLLDAKSNQRDTVLIKSFVVKLFSKSLNFEVNCDQSCYNTLTLTWFQSLQYVSSSQDYKDLVFTLAQTLHKKILSEINSKDSLEKIVESSQKLIESYYLMKNKKPDEFQDDQQILQNLILNFDDWMNLIPENALSSCFSFWMNASLPVPFYINLNSSNIFQSDAFLFRIQSTLQIFDFVYQNCNCSSLNEVILTQLPFLLYAHQLLRSSLPYVTFDDKENLLQMSNQFLQIVVSTLDTFEANELIETFKKFIEQKKLNIGLGLSLFLELYQQLVKLEVNLSLKSFDSIAFFSLTSTSQNEADLLKLFQENIDRFLNCDNFLSCSDALGCLEIINTICNCNVSLSFKQGIDSIMMKIKEIKSHFEHLFLFDWKLETVSKEQYTFAISIVNIFIKVLERFEKELNAAHKDLVLIALTSWIMALGGHFLQELDNPYFMIFAFRIFKLFLQVSTMMSNQDDPKTLDEWKSFHLYHISSSLIPIFLKLKDKTFVGHQNRLISCFCKCISSISSIDVKKLHEVLEAPKDDENDKSKEDIFYPISKEEENVLFNLNSALLSKYPFYISAHSLIKKLLPKIINPELVWNNKDDHITPPWPLFFVLKESDSILDTMLLDYDVGDTCCLIKPETDSFAYTIAYLLNWIHILSFFNHLADENRQMLASYLTEFHYLHRLFNNIFRLMPIHSNSGVKFNLNLIQNSNKDNFLEDLDVNEHIQVLSFIVYYNILRKMPACLRLWFSSLEKRIADLFSSFTIAHFSELICEEEFKAIQQANMSQFKNMVVKSRSNAREVLAMYSIEEMSIELTIKLPENHPLGNVAIDTCKRKGVSLAQWRKWHLQLTTFLTHQNGSILDGLMLWKCNLDKKFEGLQECMICFYILHGTNYQPPKMSCKNCKKKFHSACLYKWFQKSNKSTCPLCVTLWH